MSTNPIGIFDSGVGGLSVLKEIRRELPGEDLLYVADSLNAPYGDKPTGFVQERSLAIGDFLAGQHVKAIVVACNTATGAAIAALRGRFQFPVVGIEPAIKPAVKMSRSGVVGVLATTNTVGSRRFKELLARFGIGAHVAVQACPGLAERVEAGNISDAGTRALVEQYLEPLLKKNADTIVLGCTHYPFLENVIRDIVGPDVMVLDPSPAVARELCRQLNARGMLSARDDGGQEKFWTTGATDRVQPVLSQLWGKPTTIQVIS
jgi:glutamate racemase